MSTADGHVPVPPVPIRAVGYIRVSMAREEMISPALQRTAITEALRRDGAQVADGHWIEELDVTGRGFGRKGVQRAIQLVRDGTVARIYVWKFSRFGRHASKVGLYVDEIESAGGNLVSATEPWDARTAAEKFARGMLWQVDEFYSNIVGENWMEAHARRRSMGLPHNGGPRFGYLYHHPPSETRSCPQGCARGECETGYVPDPATRDAAAGMYDSYNAGTSVLKIAVSLNGRGLATTHGTPWVQRTVRRYMDSGFCAGLLRVHDPACEHPVRPCKRKILVPGAQEAVITQATWAEYLRQRKERAYYPPRVETPRYPLAGLMRCGRCGGPLNATSMPYGGVRKPGYLYQCAAYAKSRGCPGTFVARGRVERAVLGWLAQYAAAADAEGAAMKGTIRVQPAGKADRQRLAADEARQERALTELTIQLGHQVIAPAAYAAARDVIEARRPEKSAALAALASVQDEGIPSRQVTIGLVRDWDLLPVKSRQLLLREFVDRVEVRSHGRGQATITIVPQWGGACLLSPGLRKGTAVASA